MANVTPIKKILIANRGEIARRIMRTAHDMGISTVAIFADGDSSAPFVHEADTAISLEGRTTAETYLDVDKVINACKRSRAQVHKQIPKRHILRQHSSRSRSYQKN